MGGGVVSAADGGGVVDVLDAVTHFQTVDRDPTPPARYAAATLVVVNKLDQIAETDRNAVLQRVESRVRELNPHAQVVGAVAGRIDPALLYDVSAAEEESGQLTLRELFFDEAHAHDPDHVHADAVTEIGDGCVDPGAVIDLLEDPPPGVYRLKGTVAIRYRSTTRAYAVNVVGPSIHLAAAPPRARANSLVAIGMHLDVDAVAKRLRDALLPVDGAPPTEGIRRLQRYRRLSI